jgi:hypothetical protein
LNAQTPPNAFNYSAVARNASGQPIANSTIGIQISILKTSTVGTTVYRENHAVNTDAFGLFNLVIGAGSIQSGFMATINWSNDNYYLKVGMDATGGTNFLTMGTTQLLSVPYALYAKSAGTITNSNDNDTSATNELQALSLKNDTIFLTNGGFVKLPVNNNNSLVMPTIVTKAVVGITSNSATFGGIISNTTNNKIMERGIVYSTSPNPTLVSNKILIGNGIGGFANAVNYSVAGHTTSLAFGDFNNDGKVDFISGPADCCVGGSGGLGNRNPIYTYFSTNSLSSNLDLNNLSSVFFFSYSYSYMTLASFISSAVIILLFKYPSESTQLI